MPLLSLRGLLGFTVAPTADGAEKVVIYGPARASSAWCRRSHAWILRADPADIDQAPAMLAARTSEARIAAIFRDEDGRHLVSILALDTLFREDVMRRLTDQAAQAAEPAPAASLGPMVPFVVFRLGDDQSALPVSAVDEVANVPAQITRVPKTPQFLEGVVNLRGEVLPVVDQRRRFDLPAFSGGSTQRLIVVRAARHRAGLIVDSVSEVLRVSTDAIAPAPNWPRTSTALD